MEITNTKPRYKRILIKLSGEALSDKNNRNIISKEKLASITDVIYKIQQSGVEVGIVIGAGNIWRGKLGKELNIERATADYMGMMGTIVNSMALSSSLNEKGAQCRIMSALEVKAVSEPYIRLRAINHLAKKTIVIFAAGTGNPFFTTDTAACLRALETNCDAIFMAKNNVEGVYDSDPRKNKDAKLLKKQTFHDIIINKLDVMDHTAVTLLNDSNIKIHVFNMDNADNFIEILNGNDVGTVITKGD